MFRAISILSQEKMNNLIHVLGSDIPHHNLTVLRFFNETLSMLYPSSQTRHFMVMARDRASFLVYDRLDIECFDSQQALTQALVNRAAVVTDEHYFLHGQFNPSLWLALLMRKIQSSRISWHVWGADLYEDSRFFSHRLFYLLRRHAQGCIGHLFATLGDLSFYQQHHPSVPSSLLYFPTRLAADIKREIPELRPLTFLVGNSGNPSNRHCQALRNIYRQFGSEVRLVLPMSYPIGNHVYVARVQAEAERYFLGDNLQILTERLEFNDYVGLLGQCDAGYFLFRRQQGIGTLSLLLQLRLPFVLSRKNPFWQDLIAQQVPVLFEDNPLNFNLIKEVRQQLLSLDLTRIAFFYPNILEGWSQALNIAAGMQL